MPHTLLKSDATAPEDARWAVCRVCGSIRTRVVRRWLGARLIAAVQGRTFVKCERCGWQGNVPLASDGRNRDTPSVVAEHPEVPLATLDRAGDAAAAGAEESRIELGDAPVPEPSDPPGAARRELPLTALDRPDRAGRTQRNDAPLELRDAPGPAAARAEPHLEDLD